MARAGRSGRTFGLAVIAATLVAGGITTIVAPRAAQAVDLTLQVDTTADTNASTCSDAAANDCSLRGAIAQANANAGNHTILLPDGVYFLAQGALRTGSANVSITINGASRTGTVIDGSTGTGGTSPSRIFDVNPSGASNVSLTLNHLTLRNAEAGGSGAAIRATQSGSTLTIDDVAFTNNRSTDTPGGAVALSSDGDLTVSNSVFSSNTSVGDGGAVWVNRTTNTSDVSITDSTFTSNVAAGLGDGGAVWVNANSIVMRRNNFSANSAAGAGGAIYQSSGTSTIQYNRVVGNTGSPKGLYVNSGTSNASLNWWGCNSGAGFGNCDNAGNGAGVTLFVNPRMSMAVVSNPQNILPTATSTVTAYFQDSNGNRINPPNLAGVTGVAVTWGLSGPGSLSNQQTTIQADGGATATYTPAAAHTAPRPNATVDFQTTTGGVNVLSIAPQVTTNPADVIGAVGTTATFTAAASGDPTPTVQWQVSTDGTNYSDIGGATNATLSFTIAAGDGGKRYRAVFSNVGYDVNNFLNNRTYTATTAAATLTFPSAPQVTTDPTATTVNAGANATFTAAASGVPAPTVQWQRSTDGGTNYANIAGATSNTLTFAAVAGDHGNKYRAVFTNSVSSVNTAPATLTVNTAPQVTTNPTDTTVNAGANATFTAAASGRPTPTVQWQVSTDGGSNYANIAGATSTTLTFAAAAGDNANRYRAVFNNSVGSTNSTAATLTVNTAPQITSNPSDTTVNAGANATFTAAATGRPNPTVQWQRSTDGGTTFANLPGETSTTLTVATTANDNGNRYRAVFTNSVSSVNSAAATLTVNTAPQVTANPANANVIIGTNATFTATATGRPTPTVQWQVSTDGGATFTDIPGATSTTLTVTSSSTNNASKYRAIFTNTVGSAPTAAATLTVTIPTFVTVPQVTIAPTILPASTTTTTAPATGPTTTTAPPTSGPTTTTTKAPATPTTTTAPQPDVAPQIITQPANRSASPGQTITFTAAATGRPAPTVQWQRSTDGGRTFTNLPGQTAPTLTVTPSARFNNRRYRAVFTNAAGSATTNAAVLTVRRR